MRKMAPRVVIFTILLLTTTALVFISKGDLEMTSSLQNEIKVRPYSSLPALDIGWLSLKDHFIATVGPYSGTGEPLKNLLVLADAKISRRSSFPQHPHKDMEILTWVAKGTLHHQDNKGSDQFVPELNLQLMSARDGIFHAEGNSTDETLRIMQIWIQPTFRGGKPVVATAALQKPGFQLLAGPSEAPLTIRQDLWLYAAKIQGQESFEISQEKFGYALFVGDIKLNGQKILDGDGATLGTGKYLFEGSGQVLIIEQIK